MGTALSSWPPGLSASAIRRCPPSLRRDAMQAAWLAVSEGRRPDSAVRALVRGEERHAAVRPNFGALPARRIRCRF